MAVYIDTSTHFNMRMTPRIRYFLELACRTHNVKLSEYVEDALVASFKTICVDPLDELDGMDCSSSRQMSRSLFNQMDSLWSEYPLGRLEAMSYMGYTYHMSDEEKAVWAYLFTQPSLFSGGKLNRRHIADNWQTIKAQALAVKIEVNHAGN